MASIVAAGAAAYAINVNVLEAPAATAPVAAVTASPTTAAALPSGQASAQSVSAPVEIQAVAVDGNTSKYQVASAGTVLVAETDKGLAVSAISPGAGWTSEPARVASDGSVSVHFVSGTQRLEFIARKVNGKITTTVTNETVAPSAPAPAPASGAAVPASPSVPGSVPAIGAKPAIPGSIGGDDDDDDDDDDEDDDDGEHDDDHGDRHEDDDD